MEIITGTTQFEIEEETAVAIGKFDGIHIGHRRLLEEILAAKRDGLKACVFTFDPPPAVLFSQSDGRELTTREEKRILFERMGVDILIEFPMTLETAAIPPEEFVKEILTGSMNASVIVAGADVSFGDKGRGDGRLLQEMAAENDYTVKIIDKVCYNGREISSTYVRSAVEAGDMELAEKLLGVPYPFIGKVVRGNCQGRTWGFPTANLTPGDTKLLPPCGVYYSEVLLEGRRYQGISNLGYKPTVAGDRPAGVETYLYDFDGDIYGREVEVRLFSFKRPEMKFETVEALKTQVLKDMEDGRFYRKEQNVK